jgi:hypothetical protein
MIKPISPDDVVAVKEHIIPDYVFEAFNYLIAKNFKNEKSVVGQSDVINHILKLKNDIDKNYIFNNHLLDVEDIYRKEGWNVVYDKPAYCETYEATFTFTKGKR